MFVRYDRSIFKYNPLRNTNKNKHCDYGPMWEENTERHFSIFFVITIYSLTQFIKSNIYFSRFASIETPFLQFFWDIWIARWKKCWRSKRFFSLLCLISITKKIEHHTNSYLIYLISIRLYTIHPKYTNVWHYKYTAIIANVIE